MELGNSPLSVKPLPVGRHGFQVGRFQSMFTKAAFLSEPPLPCPCDPHGELAVRYANISPMLSLAVGRCGKPLREKTPIQSSLVCSQELATVGGTYRKICGIVQIRYQDSRQRLIVALLAKVRCRGHTPRLKDNSMFGMAVQA